MHSSKAECWPFFHKFAMMKSSKGRQTGYMKIIFLLHSFCLNWGLNFIIYLRGFWWVICDVMYHTEFIKTNKHHHKWGEGDIHVSSNVKNNVFWTQFACLSIIWFVSLLEPHWHLTVWLCSIFEQKNGQMSKGISGERRSKNDGQAWKLCFKMQYSRLKKHMCHLRPIGDDVYRLWMNLLSYIESQKSHQKPLR